MNTQRAERSGIELRLPSLDPRATPGRRLTNRAITWALIAILFSLIAVFVIAATVDFRVAVKGNGVLEPAEVWSVRTLEAGLVDEILVPTGALVSEGQVIARMDTLAHAQLLRQLLNQRDALHADFATERATAPVEREIDVQALADAAGRSLRARAALQARLTDYKVNDSLESWLRTYRAGKHVALDMAVAELRSAEAQQTAQEARVRLHDLDGYRADARRVELERIEAEIAVARAKLDRLTIRAPAAGVVLTDRVDLLEGAPLGAGDVLLEIAETADWHASVFVSQKDVHRIRSGDRVLIQVAGLRFGGAEEIEGWVVSVAQDPVSRFLDSQAETRAMSEGRYRVVVELAAQEIAQLGPDRLRRGYTVEASIVTRSTNGLRLIWHLIQTRGST